MVYLISPNPNFNYVVFVKLNTFGKPEVFAFYLSATSSHTKYTVKTGLLLSKNSKLGG